MLHTLPDDSRILIDTAPFIYYIEGQSQFDDLAVELFESRVGQGRNPAFTTVVTLAEVLTGATRANRPDLAQRYRILLSQSQFLTLLPITTAVAERAASLRARYSLRLPDALQVAAAIEFGAQYLVTNDRHLQRVQEIPILQLSDL